MLTEEDTESSHIRYADELEDDAYDGIEYEGEEEKESDDEEEEEEVDEDDGVEDDEYELCKSALKRCNSIPSRVGGHNIEELRPVTCKYPFAMNLIQSIYILTCFCTNLGYFILYYRKII